MQSVGVDVSWGSVLYHMRSVSEMDPRWWRTLTIPFLRLAARASAAYFRDSVVLANIVEDLPYHENRVVLGRSARSRFRFEYRYTDELFERNELMSSLIKRALAGRHPTVTLSPLKFLNYGHVCGTCRFGVDRTESVLNANNRAYDVDNLYVVDASYFPSSSGTNPSLTIAANALRVGKAIHQHLG